MRSRRIVSLPSDKPAQRLNDILENIDWIFQYTKGLRLPDFVQDRLARDAVDPEIIWNIIENDLLPLADAVERAVNKLERKR